MNSIFHTIISLIQKVNIQGSAEIRSTIDQISLKKNHSMHEVLQIVLDSSQSHWMKLYWKYL